MSPTNTTKKSAPSDTPLRPEEQGHPVIEVYEGLVDGLRIATVSLTQDRQTWIAGMDESQTDSHIGSFPSLDEAKYAVSERLPQESKQIRWIRRKISR